MTKPIVAEYLPEGERGMARITHFEIQPEAADHYNIRASGRFQVRPGRYVRLAVNGQLYMTDTDMEWGSNQAVMYKANGDVLIAGLGVGLILVPILVKQSVRSVTVLEKFPDVITLTEPHIRKAAGADGYKLTVVEADALTWKPPAGQMWDVIYFDIWPDICTDTLSEIATLKRRYARRLRREGTNPWMGAWMEGTLRHRREQERKRERQFASFW